MILAIRIKGDVGLSKGVREGLFRLRLRRKYSAVLLKDNVSNKKILDKLRSYVAFGEISKDMLEKLLELRGQPINRNKKVDSKKAASEIDKSKLEELGLKPFFRLHPPRGGIESKKHFGVGKGVLGNNKEKINLLLERML